MDLRMSVEDRRTSDSHSTEDIWKKVYGTEARLSSVETEVKEVRGSLNRIESLLLNKQPFNVIGWTSAGITILGLIFAGVFFIINYTDQQINHVSEELDRDVQLIERKFENLDKEIDAFEEFKHQTHYEFGVIHQWKNGKGDSE